MTEGGIPPGSSLRQHPSPQRVFGSSAVRFVSENGANYEPPIVFVPSDPPVNLHVSVSLPLSIPTCRLSVLIDTFIVPLVCPCRICVIELTWSHATEKQAMCIAHVCYVWVMQRASPAREHSPWLRGGASQGGVSTSPGVKRARSPGLQRDSLKQRYSPGRPGSRRHQRWSNEQALREDLTDEDLRQLYAMDWRSALSGLGLPSFCCSL